jgi:hypothetical protein
MTERRRFMDEAAGYLTAALAREAKKGNAEELAPVQLPYHE